MSGTVTNEEGRFSLSKIKSGNYYLEVFYIGYKTTKQSLYVGSLTRSRSGELMKFTRSYDKNNWSSI